MKVPQVGCAYTEVGSTGAVSYLHRVGHTIELGCIPLGHTGLLYKLAVQAGHKG